MRALPECCTKKSARARFLDECNHAEVERIDSQLELNLHILGEVLPFLELPDLYQLLDNSCVD